jgi:hypothetical protein
MTWQLFACLTVTLTAFVLSLCVVAYALGDLPASYLHWAILASLPVAWAGRRMMNGATQ